MLVKKEEKGILNVLNALYSDNILYEIIPTFNLISIIDIFNTV